MCVQQDERSIMEESEIVNLTTVGNNYINQANNKSKIHAQPIIEK